MKERAKVLIMFNPLGVTMGVRYFDITQFWRDQIDFIDRLEVMGFKHPEAHRIADQFFLEHPEYTHFLMLAEDVIITPDMVRQLLRDYEETRFPVICGYSNIAFHKDTVNITQKDLRGIRVNLQEQYKNPTLHDVLAKRLDYPFVKVFYHGLTLSLIERSILLKIPFRPYKTILDSLRSKRFREPLTPHGIMFDLQFAIDCANNDIPIYCDLRLLTIHFGRTVDLIDVTSKPKRVTLKQKNGEARELLA